MDFGALLVPAAVVGLGALMTSLRVLWEYERGVVFRLGKLTRARGPGLIFLVPFGVERMRKICLLYTSPSPRDGLLSRMPSSA